MSVNIKLGEKTISGVDSIRVEDADTAGTYDVFSLPWGYTVSFNISGTVTYKFSVPVGGTVKEPADPKKEGYYFVGWFTEENGQGNIITFPYTPTDNITLYAYFVVSTFIVFSSTDPIYLKTYNLTKNWNGTIEYSFDTTTWETWNGENIDSNNKFGNKYIICLRGTNNTKITGGQNNGFVTNSELCQGNLENLLDYTKVLNGQATTKADYCFAYLFAYNATLDFDISLPNNAQMPQSCYFGMFYQCYGLTNAPDLPSSTLNSNCYSSMFQYCYSLVNPPQFTFTGTFSVQGSSWCSSMFEGCQSLRYPPRLPFSGSIYFSNSCFYHMFLQCKNLIALPELPLNPIKRMAYSYMFSGCSLIKLSTEQVGEYQTPFRIPSSGDGSVDATNSLEGMFANTGGTFTGTPTINTTYYTSNTIIPATSAT